MTQPATPLPRMSHGHYEPKIGDTITIQLPDEFTRGEIERVISDLAVIAKLKTFTTARASHNYRKDDLVPCRFEKLSMNNSGWRAISEREMEEAAEEQNRRRSEAEKPKRKKAKG